MGIRCADHVTPLYPQKLALTSPTGDGRSVGIVRSRTKATEFSLVLFCFVLFSGGKAQVLGVVRALNHNILTDRVSVVIIQVKSGKY